MNRFIHLRKYLFSIATIAIITIPDSNFLYSQVKYVGNNAGVITYGAIVSSADNSSTIGGQISYSPKGKQGIEIIYLYSMAPEINGLGVGLEQYIIRPVEQVGIGINIFASGAKTWSTTTETIFNGYSNGNFKYSQSEYSVKGQSVMLGLEFYLHNPDELFAPEPFIQISRTFSKAGYSKKTISSNDNSIVFGIDSIIGRRNKNFGAFAFGYVVHDKLKPSVAINLSFNHALQ